MPTMMLKMLTTIIMMTRRIVDYDGDGDDHEDDMVMMIG
jgi:hypothetical protein